MHTQHPCGLRSVALSLCSFSPQGNRLRGHGTEETAVAGGYKNCAMVYLNIPNIHEMRTAIDRLREVHAQRFGKRRSVQNDGPKV